MMTYKSKNIEAQAEAIFNSLGGSRLGNNSYQCHCPAHDDKNPSLSVTAKDGKVLLKCHAGCSYKDIHYKLETQNLLPRSVENAPRSKKIVAEYNYVDENNKLLYQVVRYEPKSFFQRMRDNDGAWQWKVKGIRKVLYNLPHVLQATKKAKLIYLCEGEKDADNLIQLGAVATTNSGGAGKWRKEYTKTLVGAHVVILSDNDESGYKHSIKIASELSGNAASVKILSLPDLPEKGDVSDWLKNGGSLEGLNQLADEVIEFVNEAKKTINSDSPSIQSLKQVIPLILLNEELTAREKYKVAEEYLIQALTNEGELARSGVDDLRYYINKKERLLFCISSTRWKEWLARHTGVNKKDHAFAHLIAGVEVASSTVPERTIARLSYWDDANKILYVSRFDGTVYRLDGSEIAEEANGENVLFADGFECESYIPDFAADDDIFYNYTFFFPNFDEEHGTKEIFGLIYLAWQYAVFFAELLPTKPLVVWLGEKGSGKTTLARLFLQLLFGPKSDVTGVPAKEDGFIAAASHSHILVLDNLDDMVKWLRDKIARCCTGSTDSARTLFKTNEETKIRYRCFLGITARTPATLKRDDLVDRALIFPCKRLENGTQRSERSIQKDIQEFRNKWWGTMLTKLNYVVGAIRKGELPESGNMRLADFESFGRMIAKIEGKEALWLEAILVVLKNQSDMLLENEVIIEAINRLIAKNQGNQSFPISDITAVTASVLHLQLNQAMAPQGLPKYYESPEYFAKIIGQLIPHLSDRLNDGWSLHRKQGSQMQNKNQWVYWFKKNDEFSDDDSIF